MVELEDIAERRNYKLRMDWTCENCGSPTEIVGCVLPGERYYEDRKCAVTWDDIIHKKCKKCGLVRKPLLKCDKCHTVCEFGTLGCSKCDDELSHVIELQDKLHIIMEQIRKDKRKKLDTIELEEAYRRLLKQLTDLNYHVCIECHFEFILMNKDTKELKCFNCKDGKS